MKLKLNDVVMVIAGKDKGKSGKIISIDHLKNRIRVENLNLRTKHVKKRDGQPGQKVSFEGTMDASNVMILDPKTGKPTRIGSKVLANGKKERISKKSQSSLDNQVATVKAKKTTTKVKA